MDFKKYREYISQRMLDDLHQDAKKNELMTQGKIPSYNKREKGGRWANPALFEQSNINIPQHLLNN